MTHREMVKRELAGAGVPFLDLNEADPAQAARVADYIYDVFRSQGYWDGSYVKFNRKKLATVVYALRHCIPRKIRGDPELPQDQKAAIRSHFIMADRGADMLTVSATPMYLEYLDVGSAHMDELLRFVEYVNERPELK